MLSFFISLFIGLVLGVAVSIVFFQQIELAHRYWLFLRGKAVRGSIISGYIKNTERDRRRLEQTYLVDTYKEEGKDEVITFDLKVPYPDLDKNMALRRAQNEIVSEALFNQIGIKYHVGITNYRLTISNQIKNILIPTEELDLKSNEIDIDKYS